MEFRTLTLEQNDALSDALRLGRKMLDLENTLSASDVQELYDYFLATNTDFPEGIIALGMSFGQLFIEEDNCEWVRVSDEYGEETCVSPKGLRLMCAPISMIQKRLEAGTIVNIVELKTETLKVLKKQSKTCDKR